MINDFVVSFLQKKTKKQTKEKQEIFKRNRKKKFYSWIFNY